MGRQGIIRWGHGALTVALRNPGDRVPGLGVVTRRSDGDLGQGCAAWQEYDACTLIADGARLPDLLVDQGESDGFLAEQLKTQLLVEACHRAGQPANIRMQPGF